MTLPYVFLNGDIRILDLTTLHISDLSIHRGYGVFDYFNYDYGQNPYLTDYLDRLYSSLSMAHLKIDLDRHAITQIIQEIYTQNETELCNFKIIVTAGYSDDGFAPAGPPNIIIMSYARKDSGPAASLTAYQLITHEYQRAWPEIKSTNYFCSAILLPKMKEAGAIDVLYYSHNEVRETSRANIFIVKDGQIITPADKILKGVTRKRVLQSTHEWPVKERPVFLDEVIHADEVFITSTTKLIMPISHIDGKKIADGRIGPITAQLSQLI